LATVVRGAVASLPGRQRQAVELQFEEHSYVEIATALAMTPKAAKSLLYRARNELRGVLGTYVDA
ncbi:MAG TPA: sigma factor-like helix-turn-helix DNA-binding protein, partial [Gemmataceae bacterium]|nr:sigma factor-like helix-turn-helix DNA-binding protein [Gemmataceae bacterium]